MKIDKTFYYLDTGKEKYLFASEDEVVEQLKKLDKTQVNFDNCLILEVNTSGTNWKFTEVPWSRIVMKLI
ncbi:MAG: hypothetical protein QXS02_02400 [Candidatus Thermoplasmatota archaeon]